MVSPDGVLQASPTRCAPAAHLIHAPNLAQVTAAHAQRRMVNAAKSNDNKVNKRGLTEDPAVARRKDKLPLGPLMIGFFLFVVIGSCT